MEGKQIKTGNPIAMNEEAIFANEMLTLQMRSIVLTNVSFTRVILCLVMRKLPLRRVYQVDLDVKVWTIWFYCI